MMKIRTLVAALLARGAAEQLRVAATRKPTGGSSDCVDDESWCYGDCSPNDCAYVSQKVKPDGTLARCKEKNTDGERSALEACPLTCGTCP
jgi:hypothetical protein